MTVSIGSVVLDDSLQIPDFFSQTSVAGNIRPTIGGVVSQRLGMAGGKKFTLTAAQGSAGEAVLCGCFAFCLGGPARDRLPRPAAEGRQVGLTKLHFGVLCP